MRRMPRTNAMGFDEDSKRNATRPAPFGSLLLSVAALFLVSLGFLDSATASPVTLQFNWTISGQDFSFDFTGLSPTSGQDGSIPIQARGDYGLRNTNEFLSWAFAPAGSAGGSPALLLQWIASSVLP
jgi:hypothetical protein